MTDRDERVSASDFGPRSLGVDAAASIYDLGYQRYDGPRLGRWSAFRTLVEFSVRSAFGVGRGSRARLVPGFVLILVFLPVAVQVGMASAMGVPGLISYAQYLPSVTFFLALFAASQAPEVIVTDRQYGVLSLYLSRSLSTADYVAAKLVAFTAAMLFLMLGPQLSLFTGKLLISPEPWQAFAANWHDLLPILGGTFVAACYMSFVGLALAAFSARRAYAAASVIAFFFLMPALANIARVMISVDANRKFTPLANPFLVITGFANWLFDVQRTARLPNQFGARGAARTLLRADLPGQYYFYVMLGTCAVALALLLLRYRSTEA